MLIILNLINNTNANNFQLNNILPRRESQQGVISAPVKAIPSNLSKIRFNRDQIALKNQRIRKCINLLPDAHALAGSVDFNAPWIKKCHSQQVLIRAIVTFVKDEFRQLGFESLNVRGSQFVRQFMTDTKMSTL